MKNKPADDTTYLYLIRHAATDANERKPAILQGRGINKGLSDQGRKQANSLGEFFKTFPIDHVFCSPMVRAVETAEAVAGHHRLKPDTIEDLTEADVGRWEGLDWGTIVRKYPDEYERFMADPAENAYLEGESYGDVYRRVEPVLTRLLETHLGQTIVVVAHNVVNRTYLSELLGVELRHAKSVRQVNTGVNLVRFQNGEAALITLNSVVHLDELP